MIDEAIEILNEMLIKEHIDSKNVPNKVQFTMTKEELLIFCIKLLKEIKKC